MSNIKLIVISFLLLCVGCDINSQKSHWLDSKSLRDSLDKIVLSKPIVKQYRDDIVIRIEKQEQWDNVPTFINNYLKHGYNNITIQVLANKLELGAVGNYLSNVHNENANIRIIGNNTLMEPSGVVINNNGFDEIFNRVEYTQFDINDVVLDMNNNIISFYDDVIYVDSKIEYVESYGETELYNNDGSIYKKIYNIWRFKTFLPDLSESECNDFYILLTRLWTCCRHKVIKVENGYLYFVLKSDDAPSLMQLSLDPNSDQEWFKVPPRCKFLNSPIRDGIHYKKDSLFIPKELDSIRIGKGGRLFSLYNCLFNSFEISGFNVIGAGNISCLEIMSSEFIDHMWINNNTFSNLSYRAINVSDCKNVSIANNIISNTRTNAIRCSGDNISIWNNSLNNIGYMLQSHALSFSGTNIHVFENTIEDFIYSAIATGSATANDQSSRLTYIIERNLIRYSKSFVDDYLKNTLADEGAIYIGPQNTQGIIRFNVIENITGVGANRGIYLDDGAKNLAIYGNIIINTNNSYDIDLRNCKTYSIGIPDHNTNNCIFHNILTGGYRFEERGEESNCRGGENLILNLGKWKKNTINIVDYKQDISIGDFLFKNDLLIIPSRYSNILDSMQVDKYVKKRLLLR